MMALDGPKGTNTMYETLGLAFGLRVFNYGACEVFAITDQLAQTAFLQGDEAYELIEEVDNCENEKVRDMILEAYM